jgi:hypothetical protein
MNTGYHGGATLSLLRKLRMSSAGSSGHGSGVRAVAAPARRTVFRDAAGRTLSEVNVERLGSRAGAPMLVVERPALHEQNPSPDDGQGGPK